jgi:hypothetical protein
MKKAVLYARVSSDAQKQERTIESQVPGRQPCEPGSLAGVPPPIMAPSQKNIRRPSAKVEKWELVKLEAHQASRAATASCL